MLKENKHVKFNKKDQKYIMTIPIAEESILDCYLYNSLDAPSELKQMILEYAGLILDEFILDNDPTGNDKDLKDKLDKIKVIYDDVYKK